MPLNLSYSFGINESLRQFQLTPQNQTTMGMLKDKKSLHDAQLKTFLQNKHDIRKSSYNMLKSTKRHTEKLNHPIQSL